MSKMIIIIYEYLNRSHICNKLKIETRGICTINYMLYAIDYPILLMYEKKLRKKKQPSIGHINKVLEASLFYRIFSPLIYVCLFILNTHACTCVHQSTTPELHSLRSWNLKCLSVFFFCTNKLKILFCEWPFPVIFLSCIAYIIYGWLTTLPIWIVYNGNDTVKYFLLAYWLENKWRQHESVVVVSI